MAEQQARGVPEVEPSLLVAAAIGGGSSDGSYLARLDAAILQIEQTCPGA